MSSNSNEIKPVETDKERYRRIFPNRYFKEIRVTQDWPRYLSTAIEAAYSEAPADTRKILIGLRLGDANLDCSGLQYQDLLLQDADERHELLSCLAMSKSRAEILGQHELAQRYQEYALALFRNLVIPAVKDKPEELLAWSIKAGDVDQLNRLLSKEKFSTQILIDALKLACQLGQAELIPNLMERILDETNAQKALFDTRSLSGLLEIICQEGHLAALSTLLPHVKKLEDISIEDFVARQGFLAIACQNDQEAVAEYLINAAHAPVDGSRYDTRPPLWSTVNHGNLRLATLLLRRGAKQKVRRGQEEKELEVRGLGNLSYLLKLQPNPDMKKLLEEGPPPLVTVEEAPQPKDTEEINRNQPLKKPETPKSVGSRSPSPSLTPEEIDQSLEGILQIFPISSSELQIQTLFPTTYRDACKFELGWKDLLRTCSYNAYKHLSANQRELFINLRSGNASLEELGKLRFEDLAIVDSLENFDLVTALSHAKSFLSNNTDQKHTKTYAVYLKYIFEQIIKPAVDDPKECWLWAIKTGQVDQVKTYITQNPSLSSHDLELGLPEAIIRGHHDVVIELIDALNKREQPVPNLENLLMLICQRGYTQILALLFPIVIRSASPDTPSGTTARNRAADYLSEHPLLHEACRFNQTGIVKYLVEVVNAPVNPEEFLGPSPIWIAFDQNNPVIAELLLRHGADPLATYNGLSLSDLVAQNKNPGLSALLEHYAPPKPAASIIEPVPVMIEVPVPAPETKTVGAKQAKLFRKIINACQEGNLDQLSSLLLKKPELNFQLKKNGLTPLHVAAQNGHQSIVNLLLFSGAEAHRNFQNKTPILLACENNHATIVKSLLPHSKITPDDLTVMIDLAKKHRSTDLLQMLASQANCPLNPEQQKSIDEGLAFLERSRHFAKLDTLHAKRSPFLERMQVYADRHFKNDHSKKGKAKYETVLAVIDKLRTVNHAYEPTEQADILAQKVDLGGGKKVNLFQALNMQRSVIFKTKSAKSFVQMVEVTGAILLRRTEKFLNETIARLPVQSEKRSKLEAIRTEFEQKRDRGELHSLRDICTLSTADGVCLLHVLMEHRKTKPKSGGQFIDKIKDTEPPSLKAFEKMKKPRSYQAFAKAFHLDAMFERNEILDMIQHGAQGQVRSNPFIHD